MFYYNIIIRQTLLLLAHLQNILTCPRAFVSALNHTVNPTMTASMRLALAPVILRASTARDTKNHACSHAQPHGARGNSTSTWRPLKSRRRPQCPPHRDRDGGDGEVQDVRAVGTDGAEHHGRGEGCSGHQRPAEQVGGGALGPW